MGSSLLRLENYRSYIIFVDLNYKAFQTFLYYIRLGDKLLVLLFKYNSRGKSLGNSMRSHNCWSKSLAFYSKEVPVVTARVVSRRGEKHGRGDASGGHGRPCILPETGTCKPLRAGAARHCGLQRGTAGAAIPKLTNQRLCSLLLSEITPFITSTSEVLSNEITSVCPAQFPTLLPCFPLPNI